MNLIQTLILSIVEGITEFLPISSTGHLILVSKLLNLSQTEFVKSFEIAIQLGAIMAVTVLYYRKLIDNKKLYPRILAAFLPSAIIGFILYKFIKQYLIGDSRIVLASLLIGGILLIILEKILAKTKIQKNLTIEKLGIKPCLMIGLAQTVSMIPGISRAAATIIGGMSVGLSRSSAVEFSFLLAIPTMVAATGLDLIKSYQYFSAQDIKFLIVGFIVSFISAKIAVEWLIKFMKNHSLAAFGVYRVVLAVAFWRLLL
ncbi:undecaprenyl-diphosphate phosphatase [Candidatus Collierbacteria bacterium]|nr:undecaprenyl-diphosphate phosphatase [Candidatus Collierbacteria bacterium]